VHIFAAKLKQVFMFSYIKVLKLSIVAFFLLFNSVVKAADAEDPTAVVMHHIGDAHQFQIFGDVYLPLPCIAYSKDGFFFSLSNAFEYDPASHMSKKAINGYVISHDVLKRLVDDEGNSPTGVEDLTSGHDAHDHGHEGHDHEGHDHEAHDHDKAKDEHAAHGESVFLNGKHYKLVSASALQQLTSWYDFSITKNVFAMFLATFLLIVIFGMVSSAYKKRSGKAPKGMQSFFEVIIVFMRDEVIKPAIGHKWEKYFPYLMTVFFFILFANLLGLIPFFPGSANVTGNLGVTMILAICTFLITNFSGNGHYWRHVFAMPGVPWPILIILTPIEIIGLFIKPITLMIRLFANITAGHIIILSLVSLIFVFGKGGESMSGAFGGGAIAVPFVFAMNFLELFVAFLQAFIFTLLSSLSIGAAVEEHHHEDHETAHH
jgi:F-type H+-transporting ATPase subunit a